MRPEYSGCRSWIELETDVNLSRRTRSWDSGPPDRMHQMPCSAGRSLFFLSKLSRPLGSSAAKDIARILHRGFPLMASTGGRVQSAHLGSHGGPTCLTTSSSARRETSAGVIPSGPVQSPVIRTFRNHHGRPGTREGSYARQLTCTLASFTEISSTCSFLEETGTGGRLGFLGSGEGIHVRQQPFQIVVPAHPLRT